MIGHAKYLNRNKTMSFKASNNKLLKSILKYGKELAF